MKVAAVCAERRGQAAHLLAQRIKHYTKAEGQVRAAIASLAAAEALGGAIRDLVPDAQIASALPDKLPAPMLAAIDALRAVDASAALALQAARS